MKKTSLFIAVLVVPCFAQETAQPLEIQELVTIAKQEQKIEDKELKVVKAKIAPISILENSDLIQVMFSIVEAAKNKEVSGILLNIDCNGGAADKFSALHDLIRKVKEKKPVVGHVLGSALSGGYLVGSATSYLIAQSVSGIGSIGTVLELHKYKEPKVTGNVEARLQVDLYSSGEYKTLYNPFRELTEQEDAYLKSENEKSYQLFLKFVSENRNLDLKDSKKWAEGIIHFAHDALKLGLIDEIGTIFEAEEKLIELIRKRNPDIVYDNECEFVHSAQPQQQQQQK